MNFGASYGEPEATIREPLISNSNSPFRQLFSSKNPGDANSKSPKKQVSKSVA